MFDFTVRGFAILGCRWHPASGSIQLPVTYGINQHGQRVTKKRVLCSFGAHINRLRKALERHAFGPEEEVVDTESEATLVNP